MIMVSVLCIFIFILPMNMYFTLSDREFINYMGIGTYDVRLDIAKIQGNEELILSLLESLQSEEKISKMEIFYSKWIEIKSISGKEHKIWTEFGDQSSFPIKYIEGNAPFKEDEISLSKLNAQELSLKTGDELEIRYYDQEKNSSILKKVRVSGIFSDLTNGGKTSKVNVSSQKDNLYTSLLHKDNIWLIGAIELKKDVSPADFITQYQEKFPFAKFADTKSYLNQIFGNTIAMMNISASVAWISSVSMIFFIVLLFSKMMYLKEQSEIALLKALGFTSAQIKRKYKLGLRSEANRE